MLRAVLAAIVLACVPALAADRLVSIETRPGVKMSFWLMQRPGATATVALFSGGGGGIGLRDGVPQSQNFLIRSRDYFADGGFNVVLIGKSTDRADMDPWFRVSEEHVADLRVVVAKLRKDLGLPVWLVGTSNGTFSAAAGAIGMDPSMLGGIVLTSTIVDGARFAPVTGLALDKIRVPVLVLHHKQDACRFCSPGRVDRVVAGLTNAPVKRLEMVDGGGPPEGEPCEALHYHGFIGMEKQAVGAIVAFIRNPS